MLFVGVPSLSARTAKSPVFQGVTGALPDVPVKPVMNKPEMKQALSLKDTDQSIFKTFQQKPLSEVNQNLGGGTSSNEAVKNVKPTASQSNSPSKVIFPFTYTPDVIMKNSAILHPEEVEHALEEILGKDFRKTQKEIELEKARAARLEAKRLKKLKNQKKKLKGADPVNDTAKAGKSASASASAHFQGWA
jgi:hypothetical protein